MATINKGILGGFSGTVGTVVGANWRGKDIIRSRPKPSSKAPTALQVLQQKKFRAAMEFSTPLRGIQSKYFGHNAGEKSRVNLAVSYLLKTAIEVVADEPVIQYNKVLITRGDLVGFQNITVTPQAGGKLDFTWEDNSAQGNASADDVFSVIVYCEELKLFSNEETAATRTSLTAEVTAPTFMQGKEVQVYAFFRNAAETSACTSVYLGMHMLL